MAKAFYLKVKGNRVYGKTENYEAKEPKEDEVTDLELESVWRD